MVEDSIADPGELLRAACRQWEGSPAWTLTSHPDAVDQHEAAVRPGIQWMSMWSGQDRVLVHGDTAYLWGKIFQLTMVGHHTPPEVLESVVGDRWLACEARAYLKRGEDHSAIGMFGKHLFHTHEWVTIQSRMRTAEKASVLLNTSSVSALIEILPGKPPLIVALSPFGELPAPRMSLRFDPSEPLHLPDPVDEGVVSLADVSSALTGARARSRKRGRSAQTGTAIVELHGPDDEAEWSVRSENLVFVLGLSDGLEAEAAVMRRLALSAPHLLEVVDFDSYDSVFSASMAEQAIAEELRMIVSGLAPPFRS